MKPIAWLAAVLLVLCAPPALAAPDLAASQKARIDKIVTDALAKSQAPSASIAIVVNGKIAYLKAYGDAQLTPDLKATPAMRYAIGSVSKQFTAAAILLLAEDSRLSLDEPISRWYPKVTSADHITLRQLLSHTSGIADFWPQDYVMTPMTRNADPDTVIAEWGVKPLGFPPGQRYEYSNTGYMIAGRIVEKVSGMSLEAFLRQHIWKPLGMTSVVNYDAGGLKPGKDPVGYDRAALGPSRPALHEGSGWGLGAFQWAMTAQDLAKWEISLTKKRLLEAASYDEFFTPARLKNGEESGYSDTAGNWFFYSLGLDVQRSYLTCLKGPTQRRGASIGHSGEVSGFVSAETVFPDRRAGVVVLTNAQSQSPAGDIAAQLEPIIGGILPVDESCQPFKFPYRPPPPSAGPPPPDPDRDLTAHVRALFIQLQKGEPDRSLMTRNLSDYFTPEVVKDYADTLGRLGPPNYFSSFEEGERGGMAYRLYMASYLSAGFVTFSVYATPDGKLEQFLLEHYQSLAAPSAP
jgi:D-alanyl-D-alanine carboxypeptidase